MLNDGGEFPENAEVVVAPPSIHVQGVKDTIRPDIKVRVPETPFRARSVSYRVWLRAESCHEQYGLL